MKIALPKTKEQKKTQGNKRSPKWPGVRADFLKTHPTCHGCGGTKKLEVHHMVPFHIDPSRELDETNLITLCEEPGHDCHFHLGHLLDWSSHNTNVLQDAAHFLLEVQARPK